MRYSIHAFAYLSCLLFCVPHALAQVSRAQEDPFALRILKDGDMDLSCQALFEEAMLMRDIIQTTQDLKSEAGLNGHAVKAAGAVGSFLVGSVTGGLGLAAAGFVASQEVESSENQADNVQDKAQQRRALMAGIYKTKDCQDFSQRSMQEALAPVRIKGTLEVGSERLAKLEPSGGSQTKSVQQSVRYNE